MDNVAYLVILFVVIVFILLVFFGLLIYLFYKKLNARRLEGLKNLFLGEEREREKIARILHDSAVPEISSVKFKIESVDSDKLLKEKKPFINKVLDDSIKQLRNLSHELVSDVLSRHGLSEAIKEYAYVNKQPWLEMEILDYSEDRSIDTTIAQHFYSIFRELYSNTIKHSHASKAKLTLKMINNKLYFHYLDNGKGFTNEDVNSGIGIKNIKSRVELMKGSFQLKVGNGFEIKIMSPTNQK